MFSIKIFATLVVLCIAIGGTAANDKKIRLEDIEQDNLNSERMKDGRSNNAYNQQPKAQYMQKHHQYDVEEPEMQNPSQIVYATKSNNYHPTGHTYMDIKRERENVVQPEKSASYQNVPEQKNPTFTPANYPMQVIYVPQYDPSASNHINAYAQQFQQVVEVPYYYHQTVPQDTAQNYEQKYIVNVNDGEKSHERYPQQVNYVAVAPSAEQEPEVQQGTGYQIQQQEQEKLAPQLYQNYLGYLQQQAYSNSLAEDQGQSVDEDGKYELSHQPQQEVVTKYEEVPQVKHITIPMQSLSGGHIPQVLPQYAHEVSRPVYSHISGNLVNDKSQQSFIKAGANQNVYGQSHGGYKLNFGQFVHRKPNSLLESYIPSSIQLEYLRRGLSKEPLATYDAVAHSQGFPVKNFERGFLPNQMYPTAGGGHAYGHFKRDVMSG